MEHEDPIITPADESGDEPLGLGARESNDKKLEGDFRPTEPTSEAFRRILSQAASIGRANVVAFHLVGAMLTIRFPMMRLLVERLEESDSVGEIRVGNTVFYVSGSEEIRLAETCATGIRRGLRVYVLVPEENLIETQENTLPYERERIAVDSVESFVARMLDAFFGFDGDRIVEGFRELLTAYNDRVAEVETGEGLFFDVDEEPGGESAYDVMHGAADVVAERLDEIFRRSVIEQFDCNGLLEAGEEWLGEEDADVEALGRAIRAFERGGV